MLSGVWLDKREPRLAAWSNDGAQRLHILLVSSEAHGSAPVVVVTITVAINASNARWPKAR